MCGYVHDVVEIIIVAVMVLLTTVCDSIKSVYVSTEVLALISENTLLNASVFIIFLHRTTADTQIILR